MKVCPARFKNKPCGPFSWLHELPICCGSKRERTVTCMEKENEQGSKQHSRISHTHTETHSVNKATVNYNGLAQKPNPVVQFNGEKSIPLSLNNFTPQCIRDMKKGRGYGANEGNVGLETGGVKGNGREAYRTGCFRCRWKYTRAQII